jgi:hypothetical protein
VPDRAPAVPVRRDNSPLLTVINARLHPTSGAIPRADRASARAGPVE